MSGIIFNKAIKQRATPSTEVNRTCNICTEPIGTSKNSLYTNRDAGYGNIGKAHDDCIAKRLSQN